MGDIRARILDMFQAMADSTGDGGCIVCRFVLLVSRGQRLGMSDMVVLSEHTESDIVLQLSLWVLGWLYCFLFYRSLLVCGAFVVVAAMWEGGKER